MTLAGLGASVRASGKPLVALVNPLGRMVYLADGQLRGALLDLFQEWGTRAGVSIDVRSLPRARMISMVESGRYDLFIGNRTQHLATRGDFLPMFKLRTMLLHERRLSAEAPADMAELMVKREWRGLFVRGVGLSDANQAWLERLEAQRRIELVPDWATVMRMLLAGRAEFSFFSPTLLRGETEALPPEARDRLVTKVLPDLTPHEIGIYVAPHVDAAVRQRLARYLEALLREGVFQRLVQREHPTEPIAQDLQFFDPPAKKESR